MYRYADRIATAADEAKRAFEDAGGQIVPEPEDIERAQRAAGR
jgi:hypothetical protein